MFDFLKINLTHLSVFSATKKNRNQCPENLPSCIWTIQSFGLEISYRDRLPWTSSVGSKTRHPLLLKHHQYFPVRRYYQFSHTG